MNLWNVQDFFFTLFLLEKELLELHSKFRNNLLQM